MSPQKKPIRKIIPNTSDIAPVRSSVVNGNGDNKQLSESTDLQSAQNNYSRFTSSDQESIQSTKKITKSSYQTQEPFTHKTDKTERQTHNHSKFSGNFSAVEQLSVSSQRSQKTDCNQPFVQKAIEQNSQPIGKISSVDQSVISKIQPRIIAFNHSQYLNEEEFASLADDSRETNNSMSQRAEQFPDNSENNIGNNIGLGSTDFSSLTSDGYDAYKVKNFFDASSSINTPLNSSKNNLSSKTITTPSRSSQLKSQSRKEISKKLQVKKKFWPKVWQANYFDWKLSLAGLTTVVALSFMGWLSYGYQTKNEIEVKGVQAVNYLQEAEADLKKGDFDSATGNLRLAQEEFLDSQKKISKLGGNKLKLLKHIPLLSKASTGKSVVDLGTYLSKAVYELSLSSKVLKGLDNPLDIKTSNYSLTDILLEVQKHLKVAKQDLEQAEIAAKDIKEDDLPEEYRAKIQDIKQVLPLVNDILADSDKFAHIFLELFGHYGPRRYLLLFQNNQEMRATGGFIGSYGLLETENGKIKNLKIEGIYNPDGQLDVDVVPPRPIQKISAGWSTHDANWWPDFPTSAEKVEWFYEKTGGPTIDGVIAVTPTVLQKMLEVTGPIEMPKYNKTITAQNFVKEIQQQVEVDYDKEENKPKQILADLTPKLFAKFFNESSPERLGKIVKILLDSLREKQILIYFNDLGMEEEVSERGWSGEILTTKGDYLMVINSNINGYKTDGVIQETITHLTKIEKTGDIIDTVTIERKHKGGNTDYEWWNKVNADYMRVYVPLGSELISVEGHTREFNEPRLAYDKLGFQVDPDVAKEEKYTTIDPATGTRIYQEKDKTVFANWVYVSPGETVRVTYKYKLPFKIKKNKYTFLMQKQAGSTNSKLISEVEFPFGWQISWLNPPTMSLDKHNNKLIYKHTLDTDLFVGVIFKEKTDSK